MPIDLSWNCLRQRDTPQWSRLIGEVATYDHTDEFYDAEDLAEELMAEGLTAELNSWAVWSGEVMVAYGYVQLGDQPDTSGRVRVQIEAGVHPGFRRRGIGTELMSRLEARAIELVAEQRPGVPAYIRTNGGVEGADVRSLLRRRGYWVSRHYVELERDIPGDPVTMPEVPSGVSVRKARQADEEAMRVAHNLSFAGRPGWSQFSAARWHEHAAARSTRLDVSTVAVDDSTGQVMSYAFVGQWVAGTAFVNLMGTIPQARGRGLASACLAHTIGLVATDGSYTRIEVDVDSDEATLSRTLYERLGFRVEKVRALMVKDIQG